MCYMNCQQIRFHFISVEDSYGNRWATGQGVLGAVTAEIRERREVHLVGYLSA